jgi:hypothetical protein
VLPAMRPMLESDLEDLLRVAAVVCGRSWGSRPGSRNLPIKSSTDAKNLQT